MRDPVETSQEATAESLTGNLRDARPAHDPLAMDQVRARAQARLFGAAPPAQLGRFKLLEPVAGGGMGVIHRAHDPALDRPVALKLVHPRLHGTPDARTRLIAEARVLARLSHPNVVPVHEVVELNDQVVMVMEMVEGVTLAEWERARRRSWREIVDVYLQAACGLAAAHALGIVHRDFKATNVVVGGDGRVRVLDFGLARLAQTSEGAGENEGQVLGTVPYMSPEQLSGDVATSASDQFSFCVALYRALYARPPFAGTDATTLLDNIRNGRVSPPRSAVPRSLRAAVMRGLSADRDARHRSMDALIAILRRERSWRRWRLPAVAAGLAIVAGTAAATIALAPERSALAACDGGAEELTQVWNPTQRAEVRNVFARVDTPYARVAADKVDQILGSYSESWSALHLRTCREHRRGALPEARFDRRMACLDGSLGELRAAISVLRRTDGTTVDRAVDVAVGMRAVDECARLDGAPNNVTAPPPAALVQLDVIRSQLREADALERAGHATDALATAGRALELAERVGYAPVIVDAALTRGRILVAQHDLVGAVPPLERAESLALAQHDLRSAVIAAARRLYVEGLRGVELDRLIGSAAVMEPLSRGISGDPSARTLLLNYLGVVHMVRGERAAAHRYFSDAHTALTSIERPDLELNAIYMNLAMLTDNGPERERMARQAYARYRDQLGAQHLTTLAEQCRHAQYVTDPVAARAIADENAELYRRYHPERVRDRGECTSHAAFLAFEVGDVATAKALYAEVAELAPHATDDEVRARTTLASGYRYLLAGDPDRALADFSRVIALYEQSPNWWDQILASDAHLGAGLAEDAAGDPSAATIHLDRAIGELTALAVRNENVLNHRRLALARYSLSRVHAHLGASARARELRDKAATFYRDANASVYRDRVE